MRFNIAPQIRFRIVAMQFNDQKLNLWQPSRRIAQNGFFSAFNVHFQQIYAGNVQILHDFRHRERNNFNAFILSRSFEF
jgi:hypothetical protein